MAFLADYRPERVQELSGLAAASIRWLASLYGDPQRRVMSVWGRSVNQDVRGTWTNNALHNLHLLTGKVATPGNSPFGITGQPGGGSGPHDAGTLTDTLPRGVVQNEADRQRAALIWGVPADRIDPHPASRTLGLFRRLERGDIRFLWIQATNPMVSLPNLDRYRRAAQRADAFLVVSEAYPTPTTDVADVVLPAAMWFEREGAWASAERRVQHFERLVAPPGDAAGDAWQMIEIGRRLGLRAALPLRGPPPRRTDLGRVLPLPRRLAQRAAAHRRTAGTAGSPVAVRAVAGRSAGATAPAMIPAPSRAAAASISTGTRTIGPGSGSGPTSPPPRRPIAATRSGSRPGQCWSTGGPAP